MTTRVTIMALTTLVLALCGWPRTARAAEIDRRPPAPPSVSGYERVRPLGGPDSVNSALRRHDLTKDSHYRGHVIENLVAPYYGFKRRLMERCALAIGLDYNVLYERATGSLGDREAAGGVLRLYGHWTVIGRGTPTTTEFVFRIENRHAIETNLAPSGLGAALGSLFRTANSFDGWGWGLTNLQVQQWFASGRYGVAIGQVDLRDWVDSFDLSNWRTALLSQAVTYPTNPLPAAGLGGAVFAYFRECNTPYVVAGFSDANGKPDAPSLDSFFDVSEFYSFAELGWTPSFEHKDKDHIRLTYWHRDPREALGDSDGWGLSFSAGWRVAKRYAPFLRAGYAEGGIAPSKAAVVAGLGIHRRSHDLLGVAVGWGRPDDASLRDQITTELFYRLQISQNLGITPDIEVIVHPSRNPDEDVIGVFSLRMQLAF